MATTNKSKTGSGAKKNAPEKSAAVAEQVTPNEVKPTTQEAPEAPENVEPTQTTETAEDAEKRVKAEERYAEVYKELYEATGEYPDPQLSVEQLEELLEAKKQEKESKLQKDLAKQAELEAKASQKAQEKKAIQQDDSNVIWIQDANKNKRLINRVTWDIVKKSQTEWKEVPKAPIEVQKLK